MLVSLGEVALKKKAIVSGVVLAVVLSIGSFALGQNVSIGSPSDERENWTKQYKTAESDLDHAASRADENKFASRADYVAVLLSQAAENPNLSQAATSAILTTYARAQMANLATPQDTHAAEEASVRFQALQCAQNQRIIELLEKLNAGKK